jgi:hypothetical protein
MPGWDCKSTYTLDNRIYDRRKRRSYLALVGVHSDAFARERFWTEAIKLSLVGSKLPCWIKSI